jgi:hypothetical protein
MPLTYVILQKSGKELTIVWNNNSKRIVMVKPRTLLNLYYKDGLKEFAGFLAAGWREEFRGSREEYNEHIQTMRDMHRAKLQERASKAGKVERIHVQKKKED